MDPGRSTSSRLPTKDIGKCFILTYLCETKPDLIKIKITTF